MATVPVRVGVIVDESDLRLIDKLCTKPDFDCSTFRVRRADVIRQAVTYYLDAVRRKGMNETSESFLCEKCGNTKVVGMGQPLRDRKADGMIGLVCFDCAN